MVEQRYETVRAVIADGETVTDVAARFGVARRTLHGWLARYEVGGFPLAGGRSSAKALTGVDDHSRVCLGEADAG